MEPYSFPSQKFYNSNSSDHRQYEATYDDISIEVIGNSEISGNENDVQNMQYDPNVGDVAEFGDSNVLDESDIGIETGYDTQNEERSESRVSNVSLASVTFTEYLIEKSQNSISNDPESDHDISIHSDSDTSEYIPTEREIKMAERELKMEFSDDEKKSKQKNKSKKKKEKF